MKTPRECTVWIAAHHKEKRALEILAREIAPAGTGMGEANGTRSFVNYRTSPIKGTKGIILHSVLIPEDFFSMLKYFATLWLNVFMPFYPDTLT